MAPQTTPCILTDVAMALCYRWSSSILCLGIQKHPKTAIFSRQANQRTALVFTAPKVFLSKQQTKDLSGKVWDLLLEKDAIKRLGIHSLKAQLTRREMVQQKASIHGMMVFSVIQTYSFEAFGANKSIHVTQYTNEWREDGMGERARS